MSLEVKIPKEITDYKEKIIFGLSVRQLVCLGIAALLSISIYLLCTAVIGISAEITSYIVIILAMPLMALGFIRPNGLSFEKYIALMFSYKFAQKERKYQPELFIDSIKNRGFGGNTSGLKKNSKYEWIFEKEPAKAGRKAEKQRELEEKQLRECEIFEVTKKGRKAKSKIAKRKIKAARAEYRRAKFRA